MPSLNSIVIFPTLLGLAIFSSLTFYYRGQYHAEHQAFETFKSATVAAGKKAQQEKQDQEDAWRRAFQTIEDQHAKTDHINRARFDAELDRLRAQSTHTGGGGMPEAPAGVGICIDAAGNNRLSGALSSYFETQRRGEIETLQYFKSCQLYTDQLTQCQSTLRTLIP